MDGFVMAGARPETDHLVMNHERRIQMELRFKVWTPEGKARYDEQEVIAGNYEPMGYVNPTAAQRRIAGLGDEAKEFNVYITKWGDPRRGELREIKFEGRPRGFSTLAFTDEVTDAEGAATKEAKVADEILSRYPEAIRDAWKQVLVIALDNEEYVALRNNAEFPGIERYMDLALLTDLCRAYDSGASLVKLEEYEPAQRIAMVIRETRANYASSK
jgi:hypothetical protein